MYNEKLTRQEALLKLSGMLEIMDMVQTVYILSDGDLTGAEVMRMIQDECDEFNRQYEPNLVCMVSSDGEIG